MERKLGLGLALWLVLALPAGAWGTLGHRTIAAIAETNLTPDAREFVAHRLGNVSMADIASWADSMTRDPRFPGSIWYHFEKIPDGRGYLDNLRTMPEAQRRKGGVVAAILVAERTLRDDRASAAAQRNALKFLIHFVGDVHQPLHTGRPEDKGGVAIKLVWFGEPMSLHRVWDSGLILAGHRDLFPPGASQRAAGKAYAEYLQKKFTRKPIDAGMDVVGWLNESLGIRPYAYEPAYLRNQDRYLSRHLAQVDGRIYAAGVRLARLLNDAAAGAPALARETELWEQIQAVLGDPREVVRLQAQSERYE